MRASRAAIVALCALLLVQGALSCLCCSAQPLLTPRLRWACLHSPMRGCAGARRAARFRMGRPPPPALRISAAARQNPPLRPSLPPMQALWPRGGTACWWPPLALARARVPPLVRTPALAPPLLPRCGAERAGRLKMRGCPTVSSCSKCEEPRTRFDAQRRFSDAHTFQTASAPCLSPCPAGRRERWCRRRGGRRCGRIGWRRRRLRRLRRGRLPGRHLVLHLAAGKLRCTLTADMHGREAGRGSNARAAVLYYRSTPQSDPPTHGLACRLGWPGALS